MSAYELAQLNIGVIKGPIDSPVMADFVANLDRINALAERTPGFVWRLQTEEAKTRLEMLRIKGPTAEAFTFRQAFPPPDAGKAQSPVTFGDECPAT